MKKGLLTILTVFVLAMVVEAQVCCNVISSNGTTVMASNGICVTAPNLAGDFCAGGADADGDGVADSEDKCPHEAGSAANDGCPELSEEEVTILSEALKGVKFKTDSDELVESSYARLDKVVTLLQKHPDFKLKISGYTDNTGDAEYNRSLSDKRAHAAEKYIVSKGVKASRVSAKGYGIENPVGDNSTAEGRAQNRRVEFELIHE